MGSWWNGEMLLPTRPLAETVEGVIDYTFGADFWPRAHLRELDQNGIIAANWQGEWEHTKRSVARQRLCQLALETGGPVLELAAGPGGGNLSPLLHLSPGANIIVNDLERRLLIRWRDFFQQNHLGQNVVFAAFDACQMPLADGQIACVSAVGGFSSLLGDSLQALRECKRVLQPNGWLLLSELVLTPDSLDKLPDSLLNSWSNLEWLLLRGPELLRQAGFRVCGHHIETGRSLTIGLDGLAEEAAMHGLTLAVDGHYLAAQPSRFSSLE